jgi:hypothetical protein
MRGGLVEQGKELVYRDRYFTIWAPRQTGKSTYFLILKTALEQEGYTVIWSSMEKMQGAALSGILRNLHQKLQEAGFTPPVFKTYDDFAHFLEQCTNRKIVLILDEIEGLNPKHFSGFLHTLRYLYHVRDEHCLKSVILVGVSNIVGVVEDNASPFNIADNLSIPYFTTSETFALLAQHETETGQLFAQEVKEKIAYVTGNQPGLVNGFAQQLIERHREQTVIGVEHYWEVEDWYTRKVIDKNVTNILNKARRYRKFVETILFGEVQIPFNINREEIKVLATNGVIDEDEHGNVTFRVPLYRKCLHAAFYPYTNGESQQVSRQMFSDEYFQADGSVGFSKLIGAYKEYVQRRTFRYFREKDEAGQYISIKEAALGYSFETFIAAFLYSAGGRSYLEPHTGLGHTDLILYVRGWEYVIEFKVYAGPKYFTDGKKQLSYYCRRLGLTQGEYLVFVPNSIRIKPDVVNEKTEQIEGVHIRPWLIFYDEEKDF